MPPATDYDFGPQVPRSRPFRVGSRGTIQTETTSPGSPFDILRAVSSVERPRPLGRGASQNWTKDIFWIGLLGNTLLRL